jgi:hypothetical protein
MNDVFSVMLILKIYYFDIKHLVLHFSVYDFVLPCVAPYIPQKYYFCSFNFC